MTINEIQDEIIEEFSFFENWDDKYAYIIEMGKNLPNLAVTHKTDANKIKGCQSNVWLHTDLAEGKVVFAGDSDSVIVKGLVSLLIRVFSNQSPEAIAQAEPYFIDSIGMRQHLSMTRANGLASMLKQIKLYGLAYQAQTK
ncbi:SufE family protein [Eisenibacter elegans]|uniref:SufE family protein n=1 Tax=Eisenibacter elegans TaxID=997 RepID=UPI0003F81A0F|nr:SufE family protein [Eisenibacter elegans]